MPAGENLSIPDYQSRATELRTLFIGKQTKTENLSYQFKKLLKNFFQTKKKYNF